MLNRHLPTLARAALTTTALALATGGALAGTTALQVGPSGQTWASSTVRCLPNPATGSLGPQVQAGLFNPAADAQALVRRNRSRVAVVDASRPLTDVWLPVGQQVVGVALPGGTQDRYPFQISAGQCRQLGDPGNGFSPDGTLEYAASGKSSLTVQPGCALNPQTGSAQPYVNLFAHDGLVLNVSLNGAPLTQLSPQRPHALVFLAAGANTLTAAHGSLSTDTYRRRGGDAGCTLP